MLSRNVHDSVIRNNIVYNETQGVFISKSHNNEIYNNTVYDTKNAYRGRRIIFKSRAERRTAKPQESTKGALERILTKYLQENYDLPLEPVRSK
jgi:parallel beta-helix repeat protein